MLAAHEQTSDLIFSPNRLPQIEVHGQLHDLQVQGMPPMSADDTRRIGSSLIGSNKQAISTLREKGSCDVSYGLPGIARFRVHVFIQRGSCAVVMRVIPTATPDFEVLGLPAALEEVAALRDGIVLVTGAQGAGKSSTLAALLDLINRVRRCHVISIEDPIEFLDPHKEATIHQRELYSDTPSFAIGLRAALRQSPKVILVGEMRDRETMEMVFEAAETGHLVLSSLTSIDAEQTVARIVSAFAPAERPSIRARLAKTFRFVVSQRLLPRKDGHGRALAVELLQRHPGISEVIQSDDGAGPSILQAMKRCNPEMQHFDGEIEKLVRAGVIEHDAAMTFATDQEALRIRLSDFFSSAQKNLSGKLSSAAVSS
ncbi:MAG: PilT/PilU family type 4a pilus ATPase [Acidobacteriales bacterium]|nr:PilT/PilU family type 4a pilus ATPase [Terriglobales bacterium]